MLNWFYNINDVHIKLLVHQNLQHMKISTDEKSVALSSNSHLEYLSIWTPYGQSFLLRIKIVNSNSAVNPHSEEEKLKERKQIMGIFLLLLNHAFLDLIFGSLIIPIARHTGCFSSWRGATVGAGNYSTQHIQVFLPTSSFWGYLFSRQTKWQKNRVFMPSMPKSKRHKNKFTQNNKTLSSLCKEQYLQYWNMQIIQPWN